MHDHKLNLGWMGWENAREDAAGGYAHVAEKFHFHMLSDDRLHFVNAYSEPWQALVCVATPARWTLGRDLAPRPDIIFHTMFEASPLPPGWAEVMNCAGLIWAPSQSVVDLFRACEVTTDMCVVGYGINHHEYQWVDRTGRDDTMRYVLWADTMVSRKNVIRTVRAFCDAGLPNAELEVKLHSFAGMNAQSAFTDGKGRPLANISLHVGSWPRVRIAQWLGRADCGIYLSGGEGFGLMPLESMATGLPMIVANNTGMLEYLRPDNHLPVACPKQVRDISYTMNYGYDAWTWEPDYEQAVEQIRWAYYNREKLYDIGARGADEAAKWVWEDQTKKIADTLLARYL